MRRLLLIALILFAPTGIVVGTAYALDRCIVPHAATYTINEHSVCRRVQNNRSTGLPVMVPTKAASEWSTGANSFLNATPVGVTVSSCSACGDTGNCTASTGGSVTPGSQTFSTAGSFNFTIPCHNTLTIQVWGGGGGGQGADNASTYVAGGTGGTSSWNSSLLQATGGQGGPAGTSLAVPTGGGGSGGTTNISGGNGVGRQVNYGCVSNAGEGANGGAGGTTTSPGPGVAGTAPGGGGSGPCFFAGKSSVSLAAGGGGDYTTVNYASGSYTAGAIVPVVVGVGGTGGNGASSDGGAGGSGRISITWN